ncbi:MAG TPA: hypothetical protein VGA16_03305 [Candidatus Limnocylindria bacterium]
MSFALVGALSVATATFALCLAVGRRDPALAHIQLRHPDADALDEAGIVVGALRWEAIRASIVLAAIAGAAWMAIPIPVAAGATALPSIWVRLRAENARDRARRSLGRILASTESALRSGQALPEALRRGAGAAGDVLAARPVLTALRAFDLGSSLDAALVAAADACRDERAAVALRSLALGIAERLPRERLADLVAALADRAAFDERLGDEVRARAAGARQQQRLLAVMVPAIAVYLSMTMPMLAATLASDLGRFVLVPAAVCLEVGGILLGRRIVRQVLR